MMRVMAVKKKPEPGCANPYLRNLARAFGALSDTVAPESSKKRTRFTDGDRRRGKRRKRTPSTIVVTRRAPGWL